MTFRVPLATQNRAGSATFFAVRRLATVPVHQVSHGLAPHHAACLAPSVTKCHTVKLQHVFYVEKLALKSDRIAPTLRDVTKVRSVKGLKDLLGALSDLLEGAKGLLDAPKNLRGNPKKLRGLKDLVHKPKTTMLLSHSPQATESLKFGTLDLVEALRFRAVRPSVRACVRSARWTWWPTSSLSAPSRTCCSCSEACSAARWRRRTPRTRSVSTWSTNTTPTSTTPATSATRWAWPRGLVLARSRSLVVVGAPHLLPQGASQAVLPGVPHRQPSRRGRHQRQEATRQRDRGPLRHHTRQDGGLAAAAWSRDLPSRPSSPAAEVT